MGGAHRRVQRAAAARERPGAAAMVHAVRPPDRDHAHRFWGVKFVAHGLRSRLSTALAYGPPVDGQIDELMRTSAATPGLIALGGGLPANDLFPRRALAASFLRAVSEPNAAALQYGWPEGSERLRAWVAARLRRRGAEVESSDVIMTSGAQQALAVATQVLFRRGARISCDPESYSGALDLFQARGLVAVTDREHVDGFYTMPAMSNPRGLSMTDEARRALLRRARASYAAILEDDAYAEIRWGSPLPRPLLADDRAHVWHVGTFSKTLSPGLRVGWLVVPRRFRRRALEAKNALDLQANSLAQELLADFLARNDYDALVERASRFYHRRAKNLARALARRLPELRFTMPDGGFTVWAETDIEGDDAALLETAIGHGVSFEPGRIFRLDKRPSPISMRLSFAAEPTPRQVEGVERFARAIAAYRRAIRRAASRPAA
jgi:2-aminoadipate transaminase